MRFISLFLLAASALLAQPSVDFRFGGLRVAENGRYLVFQNGKPFFYLGDTAWEMLHRLNREETEQYLENRRAKGFNVIQTVILAEYEGLSKGNAYGDRPLLGDDPAYPNEAYFKHVDNALKMAEHKGIFLGLLPTWGDKVRKDWGTGPVVFTPENAFLYGKFLGRRYHRQRNIIWILGGDRRADGQEEVWRRMAAGLHEGDHGTHLITYHPQGGTSSAQFFPNESWIDFHLLQSGHGKRDLNNDEMIARDYERQPIKPIIDGEPRYEDHPINWKPENGYFDDFDVRQAAYWAVFSGAAGHTYGCHDIWQFYAPGRKPVSAARTPWLEALDLPGARQVGYLRRLMEAHAFTAAAPDRSILSDDDHTPDHLRALRGVNFLFVYLPYGGPIFVEMGKVYGATVSAAWFNPRDGSSNRIGAFENKGRLRFNPPGPVGRGNDWVLVIENTAIQ
jgi:hypothetical protein